MSLAEAAACPGPVPEFFHSSMRHVLDHAEPVGLVVDDEAPRVAEVTDVFSQDADTGRMEGRDPEIGRGGAEQFLNALAHLAGGLVREGDREQSVGRNTAHPDQIRDAVGQDAGLAAACTSEHEHRPFTGFDGLALFGIHAFEDLFGRHVGPPPGKPPEGTRAESRQGNRHGIDTQRHAGPDAAPVPAFDTAGSAIRP
jgi:hypothetical protein